MVGDAYTFIRLERSTKFVMAWHLGKRDRLNTEDFVSKIRWATAPVRFDVSTDEFQPYETAIDAAVVKMFSTVTQVVPESYRPAKFVSVGKDAISGSPDLDRAGTSHVERKNGALSQWCKRLTRLTYAFSRSWDNLRCARSALRILQSLQGPRQPEDYASYGRRYQRSCLDTGGTYQWLKKSARAKLKQTRRASEFQST